ncbi:MAG: GH35 family beta-galactosidase [Ignavibacteriaceae bacterium]
MNDQVIKKFYSFIILYCFFLFITSLSAQSKEPINRDDIPHLKRQGTTMQLIVKGKPFLMLAGETGNSSASDLNYMDKIWPKIVTMHLNTLVVPVYWELIEPKEGEFNFTLVDSIISSARNNNIKLVFLWFGTWKNSMSCYVPLWIKTDEKRFPRAGEINGRSEEILTAFNQSNVDADAYAFSTLMKHIRAFDEQEQTVVLVQVENEIGMIPNARDYCKSADASFNSAVPKEFINYLKENKEKLNHYLYDMWKKNGFKTQGNWEEIFGNGLATDEIFMAWNFAKYTNYVAEAGKKEYPLPMYVNAALIRPGYKPGQYPSGGPLPHLMDIWKAAAPAIDFLAPDIYFQSFAEWVSKFDVPVGKPGQMFNQFFIPEVGNNQSVVNAFYAIAQHDVMGYSPFSIESLSNPYHNQVSKGYEVLTQLTPLILFNQGKGTMAGIILDSASQTAKIKLGDYIFNFHHEYSWPYAAKTEGENPRYGGLIIMVSQNEFYIAGRGLVVTFESSTNDNSIAGIGSIDEGKFVDDKWIPGLRMNGDQSNQGRHMDLPGNTFSIQKVILYKYK